MAFEIKQVVVEILGHILLSGRSCAGRSEDQIKRSIKVLRIGVILIAIGALSFLFLPVEWAAALTAFGFVVSIIGGWI